MAFAPAHADEWTGEDVTVSQLESELARLRTSAAHEDGVPDLRTSVMTHIAWVPDEWRHAAVSTLAGLAERHPSRTILLTPRPDEDDRIDATVSMQCFPLSGEDARHVCSEVVELFLCGRRTSAPASIVTPLLISDLPVFLRWRGEPPFGEPEFNQLVDVADRLVVDSGEWPDPHAAFARLAELFDRVAASDIAWARTRGWRSRIAELWPEVADVERLRVAGPVADGLLLAGWLRSRLRRPVEVQHEPADWPEEVAIDGESVHPPRGDRPSPSELLSDQLDDFERDRIYEEAVRAALGEPATA